jgi:hypothetical protein
MLLILLNSPGIFVDCRPKQPSVRVRLVDLARRDIADVLRPHTGQKVQAKHCTNDSAGVLGNFENDRLGNAFNIIDFLGFGPSLSERLDKRESGCRFRFDQFSANPPLEDSSNSAGLCVAVFP